MAAKTNVIEWKNPGPDDIVWLYPYEDIRWGSMLIVHEYETAIFMRDGKVYDVFKPGRHTLTTQNLPLLTRAYNLVMGYGETPFKATIIFVSLKQFRSRFGLNTRARLSPRSMWMTEIQAFGEYWYRVEDPVLFVTQVVGGLPIGGGAAFTSSDVNNFIRAFFIENLTMELAKLNVMTVYTKLEELTTRLKVELNEAFKQRGLELLDLKFGGISLPLLEKMEREDPTYGLPLIAAIQKGDEDKVLEITKVVESMRALGKSPGAGWGAALVAIPGLLGTQPAAPAAARPAPAQPAEKSPLGKLRELKQMLDEGLITKEEYEATKKEILKKYASEE